MTEKRSTIVSQETTNRLIRIVRGFNEQLADQLDQSVGAERSDWYYALQHARMEAKENKDDR